jgi:hypothetical protein
MFWLVRHIRNEWSRRLRCSNYELKWVFKVGIVCGTIFGVILIGDTFLLHYSSYLAAAILGGFGPMIGAIWILYRTSTWRHPDYDDMLVD